MVGSENFSQLIKESFEEPVDSGGELLSFGFLPETIFVIPQLYKTRDGNRVDICGTVDLQTIEYQEGLRFFSSEGEFFYKDGGINPEGEHTCDLIELLAEADRDSIASPVSPYQWIHPRHRNYSTWFEAIDIEKGSIVPGPYLNRMGFVIHIEKVLTTEGVIVIIDDNGRKYVENGQTHKDHLSMRDLVKKIKFWNTFRYLEWASDKSLTRASEDNIPQMFDPEQVLRNKRLEELFEAVRKATDIAEKMNIELKFDFKSI